MIVGLMEGATSFVAGCKLPFSSSFRPPLLVAWPDSMECQYCWGSGADSVYNFAQESISDGTHCCYRNDTKRLEKIKTGRILLSGG